MPAGPLDGVGTRWPSASRLVCADPRKSSLSSVNRISAGRGEHPVALSLEHRLRRLENVLAVVDHQDRVTGALGRVVLARHDRYWPERGNISVKVVPTPVSVCRAISPRSWTSPRCGP